MSGLIARAALPALPATLPTEEKHVPALGGSVLVRALDLAGGIRLAELRHELLTSAKPEAEPADGAEPVADDARSARRQRAMAVLLPAMLEQMVLLADGEPAYTAGEWATFAARYPDQALDLWACAMRLSGHDAEAEKKS